MRRHAGKFIAVLLALTAGLLFIFPLLWMLNASFLPDSEVIREIDSVSRFIPTDINLRNYRNVFQRVGFLRTTFVSLMFTGVIAISGLLLNSACGYAFARLRIPFGNLVFTLVAALIIIPFEALALPLFLMIGSGFGLMNTLPGLFLPYLAKAFNIFLMRQYFLSMPRDIEEAARVEGASWFRIFFTIALPLAKPALATCAALDFIMHWSEYLWPLIMTNRPEYETIQVGLGRFYTLPPIQWGAIMAYSVMATVPMIIVFVFCQRWLTLSMATTGMKE